MSDSPMVEQWRRGRRELISRLSEKDTGVEVTMRMSATYRRLSDDERKQLEPLLREWLLSDNQADRYDAVSIIGDNGVTSMIPTMRELQDRLEDSTEIGARYEWEVVNHELGKLVAVAERAAGDEHRRRSC